jgi:uncharacterized membrane protein YGL010W
MIRLDERWTEMLETYKDQHRDPRNQACHKVGIPMIAASFPVGATVVGLPLAAWLFTVGWGFQLAGHLFEGNKPSFTDDHRYLLVGLLWWLEKAGLPVHETHRGPAF